MASISQLRPSTSTPEYVTFRKCYPTIINYMSEHLGHFCDKLFSEGYISPEVRDQARNASKTERERARILADTLINRIEQKPSVFHGFIKIIEEDGPWATDFIETLKNCHEAEEKLQEQQPQQALETEEKTPLEHTEHERESASCKKQEQMKHAGESPEHPSSNDSHHSTVEPDQSSLDTKFPYLDISSLTENEKADLEVQLRSDIKSIKAKFSDFSVAIRDSLESRVPLDKIKDSVLSLDAFTDGAGVKVLDPQDKKKIEAAESMSKIFMTLRNYVSFFNYEIIERLISQYGTNDDKKMLQEYCQELDAFCQRNVYEIPPNTFSSPRPEAKELVFKCTQDTVTLYDVRIIKEKVARVLGLKYSTLQLHTIEKGCVQLCFLISAAVADRIFPVSSSQHSALSEIGVKLLLESHLEMENTVAETTEAKLDEDLTTHASIQATGGYEPGSSLTWHTGSGKYNYTSHGNIEALLIVPSLSSLSSEVVPRRPREELCKDEHRKLEHQGVPRECHYDDLSIMRTRFGLDETISISEVVTGESLTCEQVTEKITRLMNKTRAAIVHLHYIGPGRKGTGDWCFSDGFISFSEIMNLYMTNPHFRGRFLIISSDCSYSGSWVREAMKFLDEQGVGPCGHVAKEKGILIAVLSSCQSHEIPTKLAFSTHSIWNDKNTGDIVFGRGLRGVKSHDGQHPSGINSTEVQCKNKIDQPCTMAPGSTWERWAIQGRIIRVRTYDAGRPAWLCLLLVDDNETLNFLFDNPSTVDFTDYGMVLTRGLGPPPDVNDLPQWLRMQYYIDYDYTYQPSSHTSS